MEENKPKRSHHKKKPDPNALIQPPAERMDMLDVIVSQAAHGNLDSALKLLFWKARFENPEFTVQIDPKDVKGFLACTDYLEVAPTIRVFRPGGVPAQDGTPAHGNRRAVPAREAIPPKDYVVVQMVDASGNAFKPIENNQEDRDRQIKADAQRRAKDQAVVLANQLAADLASGTLSNATIGDAVVALRTLAGQA